MLVVTEKVKVYMDEDGNVLNSNKSKHDALITQLQETMTLAQDEQKTLKVEIGDLKEQLSDMKQDGSPANSEEVNKLTQRVEQNEKQISNMTSEIKNIIEMYVKKHDLPADTVPKATMEQVDAKILNLLEQIKKENQAIWKETVQLAEK